MNPSMPIPPGCFPNQYLVLAAPPFAYRAAQATALRMEQERIAGMANMANPVDPFGLRNALPHSPFGAFGGSGARGREDRQPRGTPGGPLLGWRCWWLRIRLLVVDTRNRRRPLAPLLMRSGALRRVA